MKIFKHIIHPPDRRIFFFGAMLLVLIGAFLFIIIVISSVQIRYKVKADANRDRQYPEPNIFTIEGRREGHLGVDDLFGWPDGWTFSRVTPPIHTPTTRPPSSTSITILTPTNCECAANSACSSVCPVYQAGNRFNDVSYANPIKCSLGSAISMPTPASQENKNSWCNRPQRTKGDATGDGVVNEMDYAVYLRAVLGIPISPSYNPDFNGDGVIGPEDLVILKKSL